MSTRRTTFVPARPSRRHAGGRVVRARFDAATTTDDNRRHWSNADGLSPNAAITPEVRRTLRNRARYEVANNSYARGIVLTLGHDTIGPGPMLQMLTEDRAANRLIEREFADWAAAVGLAQDLRTMRMARAEAGEAFALPITNPNLAHPVKLDLRLIEADQVSTPTFTPYDDDSAIDGILFDRYGNPREYHILRHHPGDSGFWPLGEDFERWPASQVIHYFRPDRPGQRRGIPDITPALPLFAQLRRYTLAVIAAAETAADFAAVLYTDAPARGDTEDIESMDLVELERRMATVLPGGWKLGQVTAEQPATTYGEFKHELLNEIARCLSMPFNVAAGNSSGYNYASGRLDHQTYFRCLRVEQAYLEAVVLDRILAAWMAEAVLIENYLPQSLRLLTSRYPHQWLWEGHEHVDPAKEATATDVLLRNNLTSRAAIYARRRLDWEVELRQIAREQALMRELGLAAEPVAVPAGAEDGDDGEEEQESDDA